jgi:hypothetical protein
MNYGMKKPPIGIMPEKLWAELVLDTPFKPTNEELIARESDLSDAIQRRISANLPPIKEWEIESMRFELGKDISDTMQHLQTISQRQGCDVIARTPLNSSASDSILERIRSIKPIVSPKGYGIPIWAELLDIPLEHRLIASERMSIISHSGATIQLPKNHFYSHDFGFPQTAQLATLPPKKKGRWRLQKIRR